MSPSRPVRVAAGDGGGDGDGGGGGDDTVPMEYSQTQSTVVGLTLSCHKYISRAPAEY